MGLHKNQTNNRSGRPKGRPNKKTAELRDKLKLFLESTFDEIQEEFKKLDPVQKLTFYEKLIKFIVPVMKSAEITGADGKDLFPPARTLTKEEAKIYLNNLENEY